ncbi:phage protein [Vibrio mediterranei AK1]|uniref:phage GP46 family protein n=1 Tax=Vibrio mediterranei TaxID=689 RepID=UPI000154259E|nr:phage GP46 family protein [Vibrio mediterranei]EDL52606.1 phage protein [Vibrio mediterranei AK1]
MNHFSLTALTAPINSKDGLTHAVLQSVYNYAESTQNDRARMASNERGGTWSKELIEIVGSRDWTLKRAKLTDETLSLAKRFYEEALAWLINEGHAKAVEVSVWREKPNQMGRNVMITLADGSAFDVPLSEVNK